MSSRNIWIIFKKELLDVVRDRRTLGFMVVLPILAIPAMMWLMDKVMTSGTQRLQEELSVVALIGAEEDAAMARLLGGLEDTENLAGLALGLGDPLLASGLQHMLSPEETRDAMLAAAALGDDALGHARFLRTIDYEAGQAGIPIFLHNADRARLVASQARLLSEDEVSEEQLRTQPDLLADRQRIATLNAEERDLVTRQAAQYQAFAVEVAAGIEAGSYHAVLILHEGFRTVLEEDGTARYTLLVDEAREKSTIAERKVTRFLDHLSAGLARGRVERHDLALSLLEPLAAQHFNVGRERSILGLLLPYIVILMCFMGAIYPAIDLGAGEKERGTLETLLVTPAQRSELVVGKFLVITLAAVVAALLNVLSLSVSLQLGLIQIGPPGLIGGITFDPKALLLSAVLMVPVGAVFAAALLAVSIFAKSFKEAQSYATPLNFAIFIPAFFSFIPGIELTIPLAMVPIVNVSLALKEAWSGIFKWDCIAVLAISSFFYASLALVFCARWFQREEVLFRS